MSVNINIKNRRLANNTIALYFRMLLMTIVGLYTSRVVLEALGIDDFGVYSVVGGLISTFSLITSSLSGAITRFITFELGKGNVARLQSVVSASFNIQLLLSVAVVILSETLGLWFLNSQMNIQPERMIAANWVFQCTVAIFILRLMLIPLHALIIAHERMYAFAVISIFEAFLQLGIVFLLPVFGADNLIVYACLMAITVLIVLLIYLIYCKINFEECVFKIKNDNAIIKDMAGFAGWNFIGTTSMVLRNQGIDIIVNIFFGVLLNAARGIATQVSSAAQKFVDSFTTALRPQIIKSYAEGDFERTRFLTYQGTRFSVYLVLCYTIPMLLEMKSILSIWLHDVPEWSVLFCQLQLITALFMSFSIVPMMVLMADRNIKNYQISVGCISLCAFPLAYAMLALDLPAYTTYFSLMFTEVFGFMARLYFTRQRIDINIRYFLLNIVGTIVIVASFALLLPLLIIYIMEPSFFRVCITTIVSILSMGVAVYFLGLTNSERISVTKKIKQLFV